MNFDFIDMLESDYALDDTLDAIESEMHPDDPFLSTMLDAIEDFGEEITVCEFIRQYTGAEPGTDWSDPNWSSDAGRDRRAQDYS